MKDQGFRRPILGVRGFLLLRIMVIVVGVFLLFLYIRRDILTVVWEPPEQYYTIPENLYFQEIWAQNI
jgi:hypothetical protein